MKVQSVTRGIDLEGRVHVAGGEYCNSNTFPSCCKAGCTCVAGVGNCTI